RRPPTTHIRADFGKGTSFTRADRSSSLIVPSGREPARKALFSIRRSCKADSSELKFLGMTKRKSGRNGTTESRALPVMFFPPPTHNSHPRRFWEGHEFTRADRASSLIIPERAGACEESPTEFSDQKESKADSSELKFLGMTERKRGPNGTTKSRAPPVMSPPPRRIRTHIRADFGKGTTEVAPFPAHTSSL